MRKIFLLLAVWPLLARAEPPGSAIPDAGVGLLQTLLGLVVVIGALFAGLWILKRVSQRGGGSSTLLRVLAGVSVGPRERVVLLEVEDQWLLIGVAPGQVRALQQMPRGTLPAAAPLAGGVDFRRWLQRAREQRRAD